jgi:hypothetical protein
MEANTLAEFQQKQLSNRLIPVSDWNKTHAWPPIGGLRHLVFHAETNGFKAAFKRVGRRVLVDELEFYAIIDRQNGAGE